MNTFVAKAQRLIDTKNELKTVATNHGAVITEKTPFREYSGEFERVIADNKQTGYNEGVKSEYDRFWDEFQQNGERIHYAYGFSGQGWTNETLIPKYDISPTASCASMFYNFNVRGDFAELFESLGVLLDLSKATNVTSLFNSSYYITRVGVLDVRSSSNCSNMFVYCTALETIDKLVLNSSGNQSLQSTFQDCSELVNLVIEGVIGYNGVSFQWSPNLTHDSLLSILNALKDYSEDTSGTVWTVTIGNENKAKLTDEELEIAWNKGWEVL